MCDMMKVFAETLAVLSLVLATTAMPQINDAKKEDSEGPGVIFSKWLHLF